MSNCEEEGINLSLDIMRKRLSQKPVWASAPGEDEYACSIHDAAGSENCACPDAEWWVARRLNPYEMTVNEFASYALEEMALEGEFMRSEMEALMNESISCVLKKTQVLQIILDVSLKIAEIKNENEREIHIRALASRLMIDDRLIRIAIRGILAESVVDADS